MESGIVNTRKDQDQSIEGLVKGASTIMIVGHIRPDGDCIGSCLGLKAYLEANFDVVADVYMDPIREAFCFLEGASSLNPDREPEYPYDLAIAVDCGDRERIGNGSERIAYAKKFINIDHHISNSEYADLNIVQGHISSACEVLYSLMDETKMTKAVAECLYTGMAHDTDIFQYSGVTPDTMRRAAYLMSFGIPFSRIITKSYYEKTLSRQKLLGLALSRAVLTEDGMGVWSYVTKEDIQSVKSNELEANGIAEALRNTEGVDYSIFAYETEKGYFRTSLRSKEFVNVSEVAAMFGGGGHIRAAGCNMPTENIKTSIQKLIEEIKKQKL